MSAYRKKSMFGPKELQWFYKKFDPRKLKVFSTAEVLKSFYTLLRTKPHPIPKHVIEQLNENLDQENNAMASFALRLYFFNIFSDTDYGLDFRKKNFSNVGNWSFKSDSFGYNFDEKFISGVRNLYDVFYTGDPEKLDKPMIELGLIGKNWRKDEKKQIIKLFLNHFSSSESKAIKFKTTHLVASFTRIFIFLASKKSKLPSDFAMLGVALVCLYSTLDNVEEDTDVKSCYLIGRKVALENQTK